MESISSFSNRIARYVPGCPIFAINDAVVDTVIEFAKKTEIFRHSFDRQNNTDGVNECKNDEIRFSTGIDRYKRPYTLLSFSVADESYKKSEGNLIYKKTFGDINSRESLWETGKKYYHFPNRSTVSVFPVETGEIAEDPTYFNLELVLIPLNTITEIDDEVYDNHRECIEAGAMARLFSQSGKPWTDLQQATIKTIEFAAAIGAVSGDNFNQSVLPTIKRTSFL